MVLKFKEINIQFYVQGMEIKRREEKEDKMTLYLRRNGTIQLPLHQVTTSQGLAICMIRSNFYN
jgi:hypothetical protein